MNSVLRKLLKGGGIFIGFIVALFILWIIINNILTVVEKSNNPPPGKMVNVNGEKMHVYTTGSGKDTVVLLTGHGTPSPMLDYSPLIRELSSNYKVAVVEPLGYGWSDRTKKPRTVENIVEEIREALKKADVKGPYILMPHSISGVYSMYYVNKYPDEVKAIAGIDITPANRLNYYSDDPKKDLVPRYVSVFGPTGIMRLALLLNPNTTIPSIKNNAYTKEEHKAIKMQYIWNGSNSTMLNERYELENNLRKIHNMTYPKNLPVIIFSEKDNEPLGKYKYVDVHRDNVKNLDKGKVVELPGSHYLQHDNSKEIKDLLLDFLK